MSANNNSRTITPHDSKVVRAVLAAAKKGDLPALRQAVQNDSSVLNIRDKDGSTVLHCAAWKGHHEVVGFLLDAGAQINDHNDNEHWGTTPCTPQPTATRRRSQRSSGTRCGCECHQSPQSDATEETAVHNASAVARILRSEKR